MDTECRNALDLAKSVPFKVIQAVKIAVMIIGLVMLFFFFIQVKGNKRMKLIHSNLRFIIICHYVFVTMTSITVTVMLLMDFTRLAESHDNPCSILLPIWIAFFVRSTYSLCVLGETFTIAFISVERIVSSFIKDYDSKKSKTVSFCGLLLVLFFLIMLCYVWYGTMFSWDEKVAALTFKTKETASPLQLMAYIIIGLELASIIYYHVMFYLNKRDYNRQIQLKGVQKTHMLKSLSEKYKMEETRRIVEFLLPIVWIHFISILVSYASYVVTPMLFDIEDFVKTQIIFELQTLHIFYPIQLCIVGWWQLNRQARNVVDVSSQKRLALAENEIYHQRMNELFQSKPTHKK